MVNDLGTSNFEIRDNATKLWRTIATAGPVVIVPGWGGSGPEHWQTLWEAGLARVGGIAQRVALVDWLAPDPTAWHAGLVAALADVARRDPRPPLVVAHSLGCVVVARWALAPTHALRGALLVAPADVERAPRAVAQLAGFGPIARGSIAPRAVVATSDDDPYITLARAGELAAAWRSELAVFPARGHLNAASGLGAWLEGARLVAPWGAHPT